MDEPVDDRGRACAAALAAVLPRRCEVVCGPERRCRETAAAAGLEHTISPAVADRDYGRWAGARLTALDDDDGRAWVADPDIASHGGESLRAFVTRIGAWLDGQAQRNGVAAVITHTAVVRAAVVRALAAPLDAFWRLDVAPLSITQLHADNGRWTVARLNHPLGTAG